MPVGQMDWAWSIILSSTPSSVRAGVLLASARNRHMGTSDADTCSPVARVNAVAGDEVPIKNFVFHALHAVADGRKHGVVPVAQPVFAQEDARGSLGTAHQHWEPEKAMY